jgi:hypothetical protein
MSNPFQSECTDRLYDYEKYFESLLTAAAGDQGWKSKYLGQREKKSESKSANPDFETTVTGFSLPRDNRENNNRETKTAK